MRDFRTARIFIPKIRLSPNRSESVWESRSVSVSESKPITTPIPIPIRMALSSTQTHGLRPCDPDRLGRSGEPSLTTRSPSGESPNGQEEEHVEHGAILRHVAMDRKREVI